MGKQTEVVYDLHWLRVYRRLAFFAGHLPSGVVAIHEGYVEDYHKLLTEIEHLSGLNLQNFMISDRSLKPVKVSTGLAGKDTTFSSQRFIDTGVFWQTFRSLGKFVDQKFAEL